MPQEEEQKTKIDVDEEPTEELSLMRLYDIVAEMKDVEISQVEMEDSQKYVVIIIKDAVYDKEIGFKRSV